MKKIKKWCYGDYSNNNGNCQAVQIGSLTLYFSYDTVVAYDYNGRLVISENVWSTTTGKHLNFIDRDKDKRLPHNQFQDKLKEALDRCNLSLKEVK